MDMVNLFEKLGIPVGLLLIMAWGFWQSVSWFGNKVVVPLQESHVRFLTSLEETLKTGIEQNVQNIVVKSVNTSSTGDNTINIGITYSINGIVDELNVEIATS